MLLSVMQQLHQLRLAFAEVKTWQQAMIPVLDEVQA
jgi:hypothetical protein